MAFTCPRGHPSSDADYCSECGLRLGAPTAIADTAPPAASGVETGVCPVCETPRVAGARFCEVCRHDFIATTASAVVPADAAPVPNAPPPPAEAHPPTPSTTGFGRNPWAVVRADPDLMSEDDRTAAGPDARNSRSFPLDLDENLVGRRNGRAGLHPEISVGDPSVSARHLKICRRPDGALYAVDLGSTNGTTVNDIPIEAGIETALKAGDRIAIGQWTRIVIETR